MILTESRTLNQIFQEWKKTNPETSWKIYWKLCLNDHIDLYEILGWDLICIARNDKLPVSKVHWTKRTLTYNNAYKLLDENMNLGVNLKTSKLIVADIDDRNIPESLKPYIDQTMSAITPHGYHIYFEYDVEPVKIKKGDEIDFGFTGKSGFRGGNNGTQYTVLPISHVLTQEYPKPLYYEWLPNGKVSNDTISLIRFSELIRKGYKK